jgi:acetyl esterase/lipase
VGTQLSARFVHDLPDSHQAFAAAFGPDWQSHLPDHIQHHLLPRRWSLLSPPPRTAEWHRDLVYGHNPGTGVPLLADLWQPPLGVSRTGLGLVYVHGGAWRIGFKDMLTRPFFRRLAAQGHVILDIEYTLWPEADIPAMIAEVKQAILWLKEHAASYGVDPERIVVMGGSAGAHLALMAAYTPGDPLFQPPSQDRDASVCGVVAFYPPADLASLGKHVEEHYRQSEERFLSRQATRVTSAILSRIFQLHLIDSKVKEAGAGLHFREFLQALLGGKTDEIPETYWLLSPLTHVGAHCPPTLLLQGTDDCFGLAPAVRQLQAGLQAAGVRSVLVEFPHTEHAFDLILPQVSPLAQAATFDVERFLALLL